MNRARTYLRNLAANWVGYGANLVAMFFLSPFVVHRLGDVQFGVWSLIMAFTGYLGLVELGTGAGVGRFINFYLGKGDVPRVNQVVSTGLTLFAIVGVLLAAAGGAVAVFLSAVFPKIPQDLLPAARLVVLLACGNVWLSFVVTPFRQVLEARERFDLRNGADLGVLLARTGGTVWVLLRGGGLVDLALVHTAGSVLGLLVVWMLAHRVMPSLAVRLRLASRERFRELFGFSIWAFVGKASFKLLYAADELVIAWLLGPKWITYYAVGGLLLMRSRDLIGQATSVFTPRMLQDCAREDWESLQVQLRRGSNLAMALCVPLFAGMLAFGKEFIVLWMGPEFEISHVILSILVVSSFPAVAVELASVLYPGLNRVRLGSLLTLAQGLTNLGLTLLLVLTLGMGIEGVAWGTFFPRIAFSLLCGWIAMRWIRLPIVSFVRQYALRWLVLAGACLLAYYGLSLLVPAGGWLLFGAKAGLAVLVYIPLAWALLPEYPERVRLAVSALGAFRNLVHSRKPEVPHDAAR